MWKRVFSRDIRHLHIAFFLIGVAAVGLQVARSRMVPPSFGEYGPYRARALDAYDAQAVVWQTDAVCLKCHVDIGEERAEAAHNVVRCWHCHGVGREHVAQALEAKRNPESPIRPAEEWDGNFVTDVDLFITQDRKTCVVCHEAVVGMPEAFQKIDVAAHLKENEAGEPNSRSVCFECHGGHDTAP